MIFRTITDDITGANKSIGLFGKSLNDFKGIVNSFKQNGFFNTLLNTPLINIDTTAIDNYNNAIRSSIPFEKALAIARRTTNAETIALIESSHGAEVQIERVTAAQKASTIAAKAHSVALKAASIAGNMILFTAISKGIQLAITAIDNWIHRVEKARERTDELFGEFNQMNDTLSDHKKTVSELADRYDELSKGVNLSTNNNVSLSTEEYEEFLGINEKLAQAFPELAKGIDGNGNSILTLGTKGITAKEQLEELLKTEADLNNFRIAQGLEDAFKGVYTYVEDANEATEKLNGTINDSSETMSKLQDIAENGIKLSGDNDQLIFAGNTNNQAEIDYMNLLTQSINEFWKSLNGSRRIELGVDPSYLFTQQFDEYTGAFEIYANLYQLTPEEITTLENIIQDNVGDASGALLDSISDQSQELQEQVQKGENAWRDFIPNLISGMKSKQTFKDLDSDLQDIAVQIIEGLDYSYASAMKAYDPDPYAYIRDKFIVPMSKLSDGDKQKLQSSFEDLLKLDADNLAQRNQAEIEKLITTIATLLEKDPLEIRVALGFDTEDIQNRYSEALKQAKRQLGGYGHDDRGFEVNNSIGNKIDSFWSENVVTEEDWALWQKVTKGIDDATEAMEAYTEAKKNANSVKLDETGISRLSISQTIDQLNTQLKPAFDSLKSAYQDIFTDDGFTLENVDLSMLDSIKSKLDELNENKELGISIDYSSFDNLVKVLTDTSSESDDVQKAFDSFATSVLNSTDVMDSMEESTVQLVASMLESMGVANANEVAYEAFNAKMEGLALQEQLLAETGKELANVTADDAAEFLKHAGASNIARTYLFQLVAAEQVFNAQGLDVNGKIEKLKELATAYGQSAIAAKIAHMEDQNAKAHTSFTDSDYQMLIDEVNNAVNNVQIDFQGVGGGFKSAGTAGKEAADTYLEAFEKELKDLDDLKDRGEITEKQYLDALRRLYVKYFNQKKKYLKEYEKYEHQYLEGMKSLYESAFSYITKQIDKRIDAVNSQKDAAVSALEAERDARLEAIEAQKEQYEHEIEGIEAQIDAKEKEIKAMQDANGERKRAIDLQKAEYELQRMQNQKTSFVYKDGQMVYEADTSGIRDAKQEVEDAKLEIDISKIEKEIDRLEEEKDLLQERIDLLDKEAEQVNQYYDQLIAQTEKHYDAMVKGLEDYKSQFEALTDLLENAQLEASLSELGINMDALLSGSQEEFEKLKTAYIGILADMSRGNDGVLEQLSRLSGISTESISYLNATKGAFEDLGAVTLEGLEESIGGIGESASTLSTSAGEASAAAGSIQESVRNMSQSIAPLNTELGNLKTLIGELIALLNDITFPEIGEEGYAQKLMDIAQAFGEIASKCGEFKNIDFSSIIGSASAPSTDGAAMPGGEGMEGAAGTGFLGLASAISEAVSSIDEQMGKLKTALDSGNSYFTGQIDVINEKYIPAWENLRTRLAEIIGVEGGDSEDKEGRGKQEAGSTDGGSASDGKPGSIIDIMQTGGDAVDAKLEDPWLKAFNDFATDGDNSIQTICDKIIDLVTKMAEIIQAKCEAAASALHSLAKTAESSLSAAGGSVSGNTVSGNPILVSPHAKGTASHAFAEGTGKYKGLAHDEKYALRSEYGQPELTVYPDGTAELTTEPVLGSLPKGTVIFNEEQTKHIMNNKGEELGNTHVEDTVVTRDGRVLLPITPDNELYRIQQKFEAYFKENKGAFIDPAAAMFKATESMDRVIETISHNNTMHQTMVTIGDIHLHEVQDAHSLSRELLLRFPNMLLQEAKKV